MVSSNAMRDILFPPLIAVSLGLTLGLPVPVAADDPPEKKSATSASPAPDPASEDVEDSPLTKVPPGSAEDQDLWRSALETNVALSTSWHAVTTLQARLRGERVQERLAAAAQAGSAEEKDAAGNALRRLEAAWGLSADLMNRSRTVDPTRACGYPLLTFATAMPATKTEQDRKALDSARVDLKACLASAKEMTRNLASVYEPLIVASAEADRILRKRAGPAAAGRN